MGYLKQIVFGLISIAILIWSVVVIQRFIANPWIVFGVNWESLVDILTLVAVLTLWSVSFGISVVIGKEKLINAGIILATGVLPISILGMSGWAIGVIGMLSLAIEWLFIKQSLTSYLNFSAGSIIMPGAKAATTIMMIGVSIVYGLSMQENVRVNGFHIPDEIINEAIKLSGQSGGNSAADQLDINGLASQFGVSAEQLKSVDVKKLGGLVGQQTETKIRQAVDQQLSSLVAPILPYWGILAGSLFLLTMLGLLGFFYPLDWGLIWLVFKSMEKMGAIHFQTEMREIKKLVI